MGISYMEFLHIDIQHLARTCKLYTLQPGLPGILGEDGRLFNREQWNAINRGPLKQGYISIMSYLRENQSFVNGVPSPSN